MGEAIRLARAFVRVAGPEAEQYLQGQLSNDVAAFPVGTTFVLEPSGKVVALLRWQRQGADSFLLDTDAEAGDALLARLRRFLLRTKATVDAEEHRLVRLFGGAPDDAPWLPAVWPPAQDAPVDLLDGDPPPGTADLEPLGYHRRRILAGVPVCGVDIGPDTIPAEVGRWAIDAAVSFTKGCYTGQELVARIDSRGGNVPRPLRVVMAADGASLPPAGDLLDDDATAVGRLTSTAADVGLGPLARRIEPGATLRIADGTLVTVLR